MSNLITNPMLYASTANVPRDLIEVTMMGDKGRSFIEGLPVAYRNALHLWSCRYCGTSHPDDMHKCPNCGGERR
jgi:rubrerythrin